MSTNSSPKPKNNFKETFVNYLWQPIKTVLCHFQLVALQLLALQGINNTVEYWQPWHVVLLAVNCLACMVFLYHFYDEIDDWAFLALKKEKTGLKDTPTHEVDPDLADMEALYGDAVPHREEESEEKQPTHLMKKPGWIAAYLAGTVAFGYLMGQYLSPVLSMTGMHPTLYTILGYLLGGLIFAGIRLWQVCALNATWRIQIDLLKSGKKKYASIFKRILQCVLMYVGLAFICFYLGGAYGVAVLFIGLFNIVANFVREFPVAAVMIAVAFLALLLWGKVRLLVRWKKFFGRLKKAEKQGEITYKIEGSPYMSALFPKLYAGIVITDLQRYKGQPVTYLVGICNVKSRREAVILCDEYRVQVRHQINLRLGGRALAIAASAENSDGRTGHSLAQWYTTMGIEFPESEGERILLIDPAPTHLYLRAGQTERLQELDNGSHVYDYTVWTKNAFHNMLDRM